MIKNQITGTECSPSFGGSYLSILKNGKEIYIASVPSFNLIAERHRDNGADNCETFKDTDGNEFSISIWSTNVGVDWELEVNAKETGGNEKILASLEVRYEHNEY